MKSYDEFLICDSYLTVEYILDYLKKENFLNNKQAQAATLFCLEHLGEFLNPASTSHQPISSALIKKYADLDISLPCARLTQIRDTLIYNYAITIDPEKLKRIEEHTTILSHKLLFIIRNEEYTGVKVELTAYKLTEAKKLTNDNFLYDFYDHISSQQNVNIDATAWCLTVGKAISFANSLKNDIGMTSAHAFAFHIIATGQACRNISNLTSSNVAYLQLGAASYFIKFRNDTIHNRGIRLGDIDTFYKEHKAHLLSLLGVVKTELLPQWQDYWKYLYTDLSHLPKILEFIQANKIVELVKCIQQPINQLTSTEAANNLQNLKELKEILSTLYQLYVQNNNNNLNADLFNTSSDQLLSILNSYFAVYIKKFSIFGEILVEFDITKPVELTYLTGFRTFLSEVKANFHLLCIYESGIETFNTINLKSNELKAKLTMLKEFPCGMFLEAVGETYVFLNEKINKLIENYSYLIEDQEIKKIENTIKNHETAITEFTQVSLPYESEKFLKVHNDTTIYLLHILNNQAKAKEEIEGLKESASKRQSQTEKEEITKRQKTGEESSKNSDDPSTSAYSKKEDDDNNDSNNNNSNLRI